MGPIRNSSILFRFGHEDKVSSNPLLTMLTLAGSHEEMSSNRCSGGGEGSYTRCRRAILLMATASHPRPWKFVDPIYALEHTPSIEDGVDVLGPNVL